MSVSLKQVASKAGVSISTVSRVLSGDERAQIALETQENVRRAAADLGYSANRFARSLITGRTHTIGLMISRLDNPFFVSMVQHVEEAAKAEGYSVLLDADSAHARDYAQLGRLIGWPVDGILMWTWADQTLDNYIGSRATQTPVVYICEKLRPDGAGAIAYNIEAGAQEAAEHVLARGYKKPAHLVPYDAGDWEQPDLRAAVYQACCERAGLVLQTLTSEEKAENRESGFLTGLRLARLPHHLRPDVLFCHNDVVACGVYHGLLRGGIKVPEEIGIVGFDGIDEGRFLDKRLTTTEIPIAQISSQAIRMLVDSIVGRAAPRSIEVCTRFVPGETI